MTPMELEAAAIVEQQVKEAELFKFWDRWIGNDPVGGVDSAVLWIKHLLHWERLGWRIDLHKIVQADAPNCFHTHPAFAWRIILPWNGSKGYTEEVVDRMTGETYHQDWMPGNVGLIEPSFTHRVSKVIAGPSYSLWLRGRCTEDIFIGGFRTGGQYYEEAVSHVEEA